MDASDTVTDLSVPRPHPALQVSIPLAVDLTDEERAWMEENPQLANGTLAAWYGHARRCRRNHRKHHLTVMQPVTCRCASR